MNVHKTGEGQNSVILRSGSNNFTLILLIKTQRRQSSLPLQNKKTIERFSVFFINRLYTRFGGFVIANILLNYIQDFHETLAFLMRYQDQMSYPCGLPRNCDINE